MELVMDNGFCELNTEEKELVDGGGWNEFGKAFTGTLLIAGGCVLCATPVGVMGGVGVMALGATGVYSCKKK